MSKEDVVMIYLTLVLWITTGLWIKAEKRAAYLEGQQAVYQSTAGESGTCYAKGGCNDTELYSISQSADTAKAGHTKKRKK